MKRLILAAAAVLIMAVPVQAKVIGTYTLTLPAGSGVVMGDGNGTLSYTLANTTSSGSETIDELTLRFDPQVYFVSQSTQAPAGWEVKNIRNDSGRVEIKFRATSGGLAPGQSLVFNIELTGTGYGLFPADTNNVADALDNIVVKSRKGKKGTYSGTADTWIRYSLATVISAAPASCGVGGNFSVVVAVTNRSNVTQTSVRPRTLLLSGTGNAGQISGPVPASATLDPGVEMVFAYGYQATSSGTVRLSGSGWNGTVNVTSPTAISNDVIIGDFTARMALSSTQVIAGQQVTVTLTATNNGSQELAGIEPHISTSGTATLILDSGPTPAGAGGLGAGESVAFSWVYTVTGSVGDSFQFTGWASSNTVSTNHADSPAGAVSAYSAVVAPSTVTSGATGVSLTFTVFNNGGSVVEKVRIQTPAGWSYQSASAPPGWQIKTKGTPIRVEFKNKNKNNPIPSGGSESFTLTFSAVPIVTSLTPYDFSVTIIPGSGPDGFVGLLVNVTPYELTLTYSVPPSFSTPPVADGVQYYDVTATLTNSGSPVHGAVIQFAADLGTLGSDSAVSNTLGQAINTLTGPLSVTSVTATLTAVYLGSTGSTALPFSSYTGMSLDYVPGTLGPASVSPGDSGVIFAVTVINTGLSNISLDPVSDFSFTDSSSGGSSVFTATLGTSNPAIIAPGAQAVLIFLPADVNSGFLAGDYYPGMVLTDGLTPGTRPVTDAVTVTGGTAPITIIRWRESIQ